MFAATDASAQVTSVITGRTVYSGIPGAGSGSPVGNSSTQLPVLGEGGDGYNNYQVSTAVGPNDITFADNATVLGSFSSLTTTTSVNITFTNNGSAAVVPKLKSQITPGGFGLYVGDPGFNPTFNTSTGVVGDANQTPEIGPVNSCGCTVANTQLNHFATAPGNYPAPGFENQIAGVSFDFAISSNGNTLEDISGSLTLAYDPVSNGPVTTLTLSPDAQATLSGFALNTMPSDLSALGYQWDGGDLTVALGGPLAPGDSQTVSYDTSVTAYVLAGDSVIYQAGKPLQYFIDPQLVAYSGFGDPIGKGTGGTPPQSVIFGAAPQGVVGTGNISDIYFPRFQIGLPTFDPNTGNLDLPLSNKLLKALRLTNTVRAVPEPETWTLLLAGMGGAGFMLRRRRLAQRA
jgi:hypothetical protein